MADLKITPAPDDDGHPRMTSPDSAGAPDRQARVRRCARALSGHRLLGEPGRLAAAEAAVEELCARYPARPVRDNKGGSQFNDSLWIFVVARALGPGLIVESGVHRGHGTWLLRQACPEAQIHSFDIDLGKLVYRDPAGRYYERDWHDVALPDSDPADSLIFFDDHISQARRVIEAHGRGFRRLLFDDNFPAEALYATGGPPLPTIHMVLDQTLRAGRAIAWRRNGKDYSVTLDDSDLAQIAQARALIADVHPLPELGPLTRYALGSGLTLVDLVD